MKTIYFGVTALLVFFGCAKLSVETVKPIRVDINMRIDVYQHAVQEAASIEDQIYGSANKQMNALFFMDQAYAADNSDPLGQAIAGRQARKDTIDSYFKQGWVGEDKNADLQIIAKSMSADVEAAVRAENADRVVIYEATAEKNGVDISQMRKIFFDDHYKRASAGFWFEMTDKDGKQGWVQK